MYLNLQAIFIICVAGAPKHDKSSGSSIRKRKTRSKKIITQSKMVPKATPVDDSEITLLSPDVDLEKEIILSDEEPFGRLLPRFHTRDHDVDVSNGECLTGNDLEDQEPLIVDPGQSQSPDLHLDDNAKRLESVETSFAIALQVFCPFLVAGFGTVAAGLLLDVVQVSLDR